MSPSKEPQYQQIALPLQERGKIKCPQCLTSVTHLLREMSGLLNRTRKHLYLMPCQHELTAQQEEAVVNDMLKRGL